MIPDFQGKLNVQRMFGLGNMMGVDGLNENGISGR